MNSKTAQSKIIASGFTVFNNHESNPSSEVLPLLRSEHFEIHKIVLPVEYKSATEQLHHQILNLAPSFVLMLGLAHSRSTLSLEKVAINLADAEIADNSGVVLLNETLVHGGAPAIFSKLPLREWKQELASNRVQVSHSAGSYVCNSLYYNMLHFFPQTPSLFVHLPPSEGATDQTIPLTEQARLLNSLLTLISPV